MFYCTECGSESRKWSGKCFDCNSWNTLKEQKFTKAKKSKSSAPVAASFLKKEKLKSLSEYKLESKNEDSRVKINLKEFNRVLGGGFMPGSLLLFGGSPGVGKSTLLLQTAGEVAKQKKVLYLSGEESGDQILGRAERLNVEALDQIQFYSTGQVEEGLQAAEESGAEFIVVDSVQTMQSESVDSAAGTVSQVREVCHNFLTWAKRMNVIVLLVGHVTKEGNIAGPKLLEHMVDGVFYIEHTPLGSYRVMRAQKNRFGPTSESAVFEMTNKGMLEVENPSMLFLEERDDSIPGSTVAAQLEGSRTFLFELQSLVQRSYQGFPRRTSQGIDQNRISVLLAVLEKKCNFRFSESDVYTKVIGGSKIVDSAADLALCMSLASAYKNIVLPKDVLFLGEVGLGGELRSAVGLELRLKEAENLGFKFAVVPARSKTKSIDSKLKLLSFKDVEAVIGKFLL